MAPYEQPPLADYVVKLMLLEAIKCYKDEDGVALHWLEAQLFKITNRWAELDRNQK